MNGDGVKPIFAKPAAEPPTTQAQSSQSQNQQQRKGSNLTRIALPILLLGGAAYAYTAYFDSTGASSRSTSLNNSTFTPFRLVQKEKVSSTCSTFTLEQQSATTDAINDMWNSSKVGVWSIDIKQPQLQIARSYTPLPPVVEAPLQNNKLRLLVRKEHKGEMSNYIHNTPDQGTLELRGPAVEFELPPNVERVVFLAGGTGIAPALQIAHALQHSQTPAHVTVLWANRKREDCTGGKSDTNNTSSNMFTAWFRKNDDASSAASSNAVVRQLDSLKLASLDNLTVHYFVDEEGTFVKPKDVASKLQLQRQSRQEQDHSPHPSTTPSQGQNIIFVSGPEGFLNYWAGPKQWKDGREIQGPLAGVLSQFPQIRSDAWKVVKL
ncbi:hypothetical protein AAFC00_005061 [Neodothiora populina]|uniref:FAD-binding FR-type domain-containing protein n=1 Tax=Neodothiora populina TaxID=2781224 RepID=A0ABR3PJM8_9PEZI